MRDHVILLTTRPESKIITCVSSLIISNLLLCISKFSVLYPFPMCIRILLDQLEE